MMLHPMMLKGQPSRHRLEGIPQLYQSAFAASSSGQVKTKIDSCSAALGGVADGAVEVSGSSTLIGCSKPGHKVSGVS